jgi:hypothetical protein
MSPRELVEIAKALTSAENVSVRDLTLTIETEEGVKDVVIHSNDDLFRPFHVKELAFDDAEELLSFLTEA